jgi:hypothetical protein
VEQIAEAAGIAYEVTRNRVQAGAVSAQIVDDADEP